jgi:hypothetical protein
VAGDLRGATFLALRMEGVAGMGATIGSRAVNLAAITGHGASIEDGTDRNLLDTEFGQRVESRLGELYQRTWDLLEENRPQVLALAHALEVHRTVSGDDVAAIVDGSVGPLVDGRLYTDAPLQAALERYHTVAVAAHHGHCGVDLPLPGIGGVAARPGTAGGGGPSLVGTADAEPR